MASGASGARARTPSRIGRPGGRTLTEPRVKKICELVRRGVPQEAAAGAVGIPRRTFQHWLAKGREEEAEEPYRSLAERLEAALDEFHASRAILVGETKEARTTLEVLARRFPKDWADPERGGVTVNVGVIVESPEWAALRDAALIALARHPEALADYLAAIGGAPVVEGEVVRELAP